MKKLTLVEKLMVLTIVVAVATLFYFVATNNSPLDALTLTHLVEFEGIVLLLMLGWMVLSRIGK